MATVNKDLLEASIFRSLEQHRVADEVAEEIAQMLVNEVLPDIARQIQALPFNMLSATDFRLIELRNAIENGMGWQRVVSRLNERMRETMVDEAGIAVQQLDEVTPPLIQFIMPGPDLLTALVMERPFEDKLLSEWFAELGTDTQEELYQTFRVAMSEGKSIPKIAADLLERNYAAFTTGGVNKAINNAKAVARTAANLVQNRAREAVYQQNEDVVAGVEYVATLDDRTTLICMNLHGNVYPVGRGERPPQHVQCRSTTVPVLKSWEEMGIPRDQLTEEQRKNLDGKAAKVQSFDKWIRGQDVETQNKLLGPVRAEMWREGRVRDISGFVDNNGATIPLKEFGLNRAGNPLETVS